VPRILDAGATATNKIIKISCPQMIDKINYYKYNKQL
jgi:hypothetical protein